MAPYGTSYLYHREYSRGEGRSGNFNPLKSLHMLVFFGAHALFLLDASNAGNRLRPLVSAKCPQPRAV